MSGAQHPTETLSDGLRCDDGISGGGAHAVRLRRRVVSDFEDIADRLCGEARGPIGVAVSGGGDSVALLLLAHRWAQARRKSLLALTFDHDMRDDSAAEAANVAALCGELGIAHRIFKWTDPRKGQANARFARHGGLADSLRAAGGTHLMMGHTADDQRETFLLRARQGSHWYGLGGIRELSVSPAWPEGRGIMIVRPLLGEARKMLRDYLTDANVSWVDDPSNKDPAYERIRMRHRLGASARLGPRIDAIQARIADLRQAEDRKMADWMRASVAIESEGRVVIQVGEMHPESLARALSFLLQMASGGGRPPRGDAMARLVEQVLASPKRQRHTLAGVIITVKNRMMTLVREPAAISDMPLEEDIWDKRFVRTGEGPCDVDMASDDIPAAMRAVLPPTGRWNCLLNGRFCAFLRMLDSKR